MSMSMLRPRPFVGFYGIPPSVIDGIRSLEFQAITLSRESTTLVSRVSGYFPQRWNMPNTEVRFEYRAFVEWHEQFHFPLPFVSLLFNGLSLKLIDKTPTYIHNAKRTAVDIAFSVSYLLFASLISSVASFEQLRNTTN